MVNSYQLITANHQRDRASPVLGGKPFRSTRFTNSANHQPLRGDARWDARLLEGRFAIATA
ncbi:MAG: hypothetical protein ACHBN1_34340 [Heteroscytonema crispum UTEX LB 1556]